MKCPHESRQVGLTSIVLFSIKILFKKNHSIAELAARHNYDGIFNGKIGLLLSDPRDDFFEGGERTSLRWKKVEEGVKVS